MNCLETTKITESILLVDDQPANLRVLTQMLKGKNYKVKKALDGESAILATLSNPPDVIVLDIQMPNMDGYQVCRQLKANPKTNHIPVIFISALSDVFDKVTAFEAGGIDYITKPFQEEEVLARINSQLTIQRQKKLLYQEKQILQAEIRQHKETQAILLQSKAILASILNASLDAIAALEAVRNEQTGEIEDFRFSVANPMSAKIFEREPKELIGELVYERFIDYIKPELFADFIHVTETGESLDREVACDSSDGLRWFHCIAVKLGDGFSVTLRDITKKKQLELKLNKLATIDSLTDVYNRHSFDLNLEKEWQRCSRGDQPLSLILCDVDYFKSYNDIYGHQMGDQCLIKVAQTMNRVTRRISDLVCRYGGEEFAIILPNTSLDGAFQVAQTICQEIEKLHIPHQGSQIGNYITISAGVCCLIPTPQLSLQLLISKADQALYHAKNNNRNQVQFVF